MAFIPNREELAWAAGFFDGEGCVHVENNNGRPYMRMVVCQARSPELIERFYKALGSMGTLRGPFMPSRNGFTSNPLPQWETKINGFMKCQAAMIMLWSFLGSRKREQFKAAHKEVLQYKLQAQERKGELLSQSISPAS